MNTGSDIEVVAQLSHVRKVLCAAIQQSSKSKVSVSWQELTAVDGSGEATARDGAPACGLRQARARPPSSTSAPPPSISSACVWSRLRSRACASLRRPPARARPSCVRVPSVELWRALSVDLRRFLSVEIRCALSVELRRPRPWSSGPPPPSSSRVSPPLSSRVGLQGQAERWRSPRRASRPEAWSSTRPGTVLRGPGCGRRPPELRTRPTN